MNKKVILKNNNRTFFISMSNESAKAKTNKLLTLFQQRFFWYSLSQFQYEYKINGFLNDEIEISINDFYQFFNISSSNTYQSLKKNARVMSSIQIELINDIEEKFKFFTIFPSFEYANGTIKVSFNKKLNKHYFDLKNKFILANLKKLINFKNKYTWYFYSLFKATVFKNKIGYKKITIIELKEKLFVNNLSGYNKYGIFKSKILNPALIEINEKTNIYCSFKEIKNKKKIEFIVFKIINNENN